jgi:deoxyhypusine monooxygenase
MPSSVFLFHFISALKNKDNGSLMRHELAYIMGQMQYEESSPLLEEILATEGEDILVRHESAEALGAIGCPKFLPLLEEYAQHAAPEISETCQIAVDMINYKLKLAEDRGHAGSSSSSIYASIDPAPPVTEAKSLAQHRATYLDKSLSLFERYRAMFSLRDMNSDESVEVLVEGKKNKTQLSPV